MVHCCRPATGRLQVLDSNFACVRFSQEYPVQRQPILIETNANFSLLKINHCKPFTAERMSHVRPTFNLSLTASKS
jgi:hypothetical protein